MSHHTMQVATLVLIAVAAVFSLLNIWMNVRHMRRK